MQQVVEVISRKLAEHSSVSDEMVRALEALTPQVRTLALRQDIVRQGDRPTVSVVVLTLPPTFIQARLESGGSDGR